MAIAGLALLALAACSGRAVSAVGTWGEDGDGQPQLVLDAGGQLSGTDGCNRLMGSWEQDGQSITFGLVATSLMACPDVNTWLLGLSTARIEGDVLHVSDDSGTQIGSLNRSFS